MTTYLHSVAPLDGYIADENDDVWSIHDRYFDGDQPILDGDSGFRVSAASADYVREMWERQSVLVIGRHLFDMTDGWGGKPPAADHVIVVSHRPKQEGWHPEGEGVLHLRYPMPNGSVDHSVAGA